MFQQIYADLPKRELQKNTVQISFFKNKSSRYGLSILSVIAVFASSCTTSADKGVYEGIIEYNASPIDKENSMASLAPNKMIVKFKANKASVQMSAGMGLFNTIFITDQESKNLTQLVKFLNKKTALVMDSVKVMKENNNTPVNIEYLNETKMIAGYKCKKARITPRNKAHQPFDVYYTEEIGIENPNFATPYYAIKGVLMEYQLKRYGLEMKFTATNVKKINVEDSEFELPSDYKLVSEQEMNELFMSFQ